MSNVIPVRCEPGGWGRLQFSTTGYAVTPEALGERVERWSDRLFNGRALAIAFGLAILLSLLAAPVTTRDDASDVMIMAAGGPAFLCAAYLLIGLLVHVAAEFAMFVLVVLTFPLLIFRPYRRLLFSPTIPVEQRPGFVPAAHVVQSWEHPHGKGSAVTVRFTNGAQITYTARAPHIGLLAREFARLLGPRHIPAAPVR